MNQVLTDRNITINKTNVVPTDKERRISLSVTPDTLMKNGKFLNISFACSMLSTGHQTTNLGVGSSNLSGRASFEDIPCEIARHSHGNRTVEAGKTRGRFGPGLNSLKAFSCPHCASYLKTFCLLNHYFTETAPRRRTQRCKCSVSSNAQTQF
jgi:hypothetical protein